VEGVKGKEDLGGINWSGNPPVGGGLSRGGIGSRKLEQRRRFMRGAGERIRREKDRKKRGNRRSREDISVHGFQRLGGGTDKRKWEKPGESGKTTKRRS